MQRITSFITTLNNPVKYGSVGYFCCAVIYTSYCSYNDSVNTLDNYRQHGETDKYKTDFEACKHGAYENFGCNFFDSIIWPFTVARNAIPRAVLAINPPKKD